VLTGAGNLEIYSERGLYYLHKWMNGLDRHIYWRFYHTQCAELSTGAFFLFKGFGFHITLVHGRDNILPRKFNKNISIQ